MPNDLEKINYSLKNGKIVIFPTETVYAIAVDATNKIGVDLLYRIKKRDKKKQFSIMVPNINWLKNLAVLTERQLLFVKCLIDEPITFVMYVNSKFMSLLHYQYPEEKGVAKIGIRIPNHDIAKNILTRFDSPIVATSVNISGMYSATSFKDIDTKILNYVDSYYKDDSYVKSIHSTVIDITSDIPKILRVGATHYDNILCVWNDIMNQNVNRICY